MSYNYSAGGSYYVPSSSDKSQHRVSVASQQSYSSWGTIESATPSHPSSYSATVYPQTYQPSPGAPLMQPVPLPNVSSPHSQSTAQVINPALTRGSFTFNLATGQSTLSSGELNGVATNPKFDFVMIAPPDHLPQSWGMQVHHAGGVTVKDILDKIYISFNEAVSAQEYQMSPAQAHAQAAFLQRTGKNVQPYSQGVIRRDFLPGSVCSVSLGLISMRDGVLYAKLHLSAPVYHN